MAQSGGFQFHVEYRLTGLNSNLSEIVNADNYQFVIPAFLMKFYGPDGNLTNPPGPEYIKVYVVDRDIGPVDTWKKPK